jgi:hypothetical protein
MTTMNDFTKETIEHFLNEKFLIISKKLPQLIEMDCASFSTGHAMGYKQALLDLDCLLKDYEDNSEC